MKNMTRRDFLWGLGGGLGGIALADLLGRDHQLFAAAKSTAKLDYPPKAKRVVQFFMSGGASHLDMFDYKPELEKYAGKPPGESTGLNSQKGRKLMPSPWKFKQHGESGLPISELYPYLSKQADELCLINGAHTDLPNHPQALVQLHTGSFQFVRPSMGAWTLYGLGTENQNLPGFITIKPPARLGEIGRAHV